ncbi:hypothetical protein [Mesorhizobium prunaredense]|nr:hypothetical protein [Mesorhizobium prunaredense]
MRTPSERPGAAFIFTAIVRAIFDFVIWSFFGGLLAFIGYYGFASFAPESLKNRLGLEVATYGFFWAFRPLL